MGNKKQCIGNENHNSDLDKDKNCNLDAIIVDENYPGPKENDIDTAEKPGIKGQEELGNNSTGEN